MGGERRLRPLLPVAERADIDNAERLAPLLGESPSRKNAEGEKLPGVSPWSVTPASGVPAALNPEPKNEADMLLISMQVSWFGTHVVAHVFAHVFAWHAYSFYIYIRMRFLT